MPYPPPPANFVPSLGFSLAQKLHKKGFGRPFAAKSRVLAGKLSKIELLVGMIVAVQRSVNSSPRVATICASFSKITLKF
jgi:hypothetical protein